MLDIESFLLGIAAGGGNPNYVETITGTLANPWGEADYQELFNGISSNDLTVVMTSGGSSLMAAALNGILFSVVKFDAPEDTDPVLGASVFYSTSDEGALTFAKASFVSRSWVDLPSATPTTLTIIHHPMP